MLTCTWCGNEIEYGKQHHRRILCSQDRSNESPRLFHDLGTECSVCFELMERQVSSPTRMKLPSRRHSWTKKVHIQGQVFYLGVGEYEDGRPGEIFITASRHGTFVRGILDALARMASVALQCGAPITEVIKSIEALNFPPNGAISKEESENEMVKEVTSVVDWIAQELRYTYLEIPSEPDPTPVKERVVGNYHRGSGV